MRSRTRFSPTGSPSATPIPLRALDALRRGLVIAQDSGNRANETHLAHTLSRLEAEHGDPLAALRLPHSGDPQLPRLRQHNHDAQPPGYPRRRSSTGSDATNRRPPSPVSRSVPSPQRLPEFNTAIAHLRDVLGDQTYESLARKGETMTTAAMVTYAYDQIDQARAELNAVSK